MSLRPVQAAFFWRLDDIISNFRPIYGRRGSSGGYTKDFLQSPGNQQRAIDAALGRTDAPVSVEYRWPGGGQLSGEWRDSAVADDRRGQLAWLHNQPPAPWRVGDPTSDPVVTVPGDPNETTPAAADTVHKAIVDSKIAPGSSR